MKNDKVDRYKEQISFWSNGEKDQLLLTQKTVAVIGAGALGTVIANHLVRAGIGSLKIVDRDFVEITNLQRQMLYDEWDVSKHEPKVIAAAKKLKQINADVSVTPFVLDINQHTIEAFIHGSDLIIDATDNMETRFLINDVSIKYQIPWIYGGAIHTRGMYFSVVPGETPCLQCLFPGAHHHHGETCDTVGVLGPLVHIIASLQVTEAFKILLGNLEKVNRHLNQLDTWYFDYDQLPIEYSTNPDCPCCAKKEFNYLDQQSEGVLLSQLCGRDSIQISPSTPMNIPLKDWEKRWAPIGKVTCTPFLLRLNYERYQLTLFQDGRLIIKGTTDEVEAKKLYSRFIGN